MSKWGAIVKGVCEICGQPFERHGHGPKRDKGMLCSTQCSARNAAIARWGKTEQSKTCPHCGGEKRSRSTQCADCRWKNSVRLSPETTLGELRTRFRATHFHAKIRGHARTSYGGPMACLACGYTLHVEIAHRRPVGTFPDSATIAEVNADENLVALDKRCHWEYDQGYLELPCGASQI